MVERGVESPRSGWFQTHNLNHYASGFHTLASESSGEPTQLDGFALRVSNSVGCEYSPRTRIPSKFPGDADALVQVLHFENHWLCCNRGGSPSVLWRNLSPVSLDKYWCQFFLYWNNQELTCSLWKDWLTENVKQITNILNFLIKYFVSS